VGGRPEPEHTDWGNGPAIRKANDLVNKLIAKGFVDEYKDLIKK
jgi:hypothetical protein